MFTASSIGIWEPSPNFKTSSDVFGYCESMKNGQDPWRWSFIVSEVSCCLSADGVYGKIHTVSKGDWWNILYVIDE